MSAGICKYFQQGNCRYGNSCRFSHAIPSQRSAFSAAPSAVSAFGDRNAGVGQHSAFQRDSGRAPAAYGDEAAKIQALRIDLEGVDRPNWKISCFNHTKDEPGNDISGTDVSAEELRELYYRERKSGSAHGYHQLWVGVHREMENRVRTLLARPQEIVRGHRPPQQPLEVPGLYWRDGGLQAPAAASSNAALGTTSAFSSAASQPRSAFGGIVANPSLGPSTAFAASTVASQPSSGTGTFGSATPGGGLHAAPAFAGQQALQAGPSSAFTNWASQAVGGAGTTFGSPAFGGAANAFQGAPAPSAASQPTGVGPLAFGQPSRPAGFSGLPSGSAFSFQSAAAMQGAATVAASAPTPSFQSATNQQTQSAFGPPPAQAPATQRPTSSFGASAFAASQPSAFGQSAFGQSAFGQSAFGQSAFGQSAFGQSALGQSAFGHSSSGPPSFANPAPASEGEPDVALSPEDLAAYNAKDFDRYIPEIPPPVYLRG